MPGTELADAATRCLALYCTFIHGCLQVRTPPFKTPLRRYSWWGLKTIFTSKASSPMLCDAMCGTHLPYRRRPPRTQYLVLIKCIFLRSSYAMS
eukprot:2326985-Rhodomonas_salina.1